MLIVSEDSHATFFAVDAAAVGGYASAQQYDLLLQRGHVIDPRNKVSAVRDVAIHDGQIAAVADQIDTATALKTIDVSGLYVTPGLIDIHVHVFAGTGEERLLRGRPERRIPTALRFAAA